ncbi:ADP-ribose pyrophosphatase YjhB (NUDIX family) [Tamaricihabitans halophyticus]|uniref:ADP-ribose pyrophosphatase YjhB (NUDIX family) n=1 Tax=Tamaricihabitans halophyticus TaxID=1262583 RepID=A0A4R2QPJ2_9PSEU|nr:NUDIX domain-containing protein [Tamaricihabitans halophyticus]TCP50874.1 ADP-ribose pyrophosphatase YjhB (NUDIX family) [Tamaricihabitans halophyticus]
MTGGDELVARYDENGDVIGSAQRSAVRAEGLWHASSGILVRSGDGERVYVHLRSASKDVFPSMYDCWAGGVVAAGETPEQAAYRELAEELGVSGTVLRHLFTDVYDQPPVRVHAYCFEARWDGPIVHQEAEIVAGEWLPVTELRARLTGEWPFVPDGRQFALRWLDLTSS